MSMLKVWPTAVRGPLSRAACSMPEPSISTWRVGSETMSQTWCAGAAIRPVADTRSGGAVSLTEPSSAAGFD